MSVDFAIDRDSWCTPRWLTELLPEVDLDPCGNHRSTVKCRDFYCLENGDAGLSLPWVGSVFVNPPYSDIQPWANRALQVTVTECGFLVNVDSSTQWWKTITKRCHRMLLFYKRIQFDAPPGVSTSSNSRPQALLCDKPFWDRCDPRLEEHGSLWILV